MYHGINAFSKTSSIHALLNRVEVVGDVMACWSNKPIGHVGVFTDITHAEKVDFISSSDVWSYVDDIGNRVTDRSVLFDNADQHWIEEGEDLYSLYLEYSDRAKKYVEIFAQACPSAIWVKKGASTKWHKVARVLARKFGLIVMEV